MISFIITNYHSTDELMRCLDDLERLPDATTFEVIIVNNDKQPLSLPHRRFGAQKYHHIGHNVGYARANNAGLHHATQQYVCFLNPDTHSFAANLTDILDHLTPNTIAVPQIRTEHGAPQQWSVGDEVTLWNIIKNNMGLHKKPWHAKSVRPVAWASGAALFAHTASIKNIGGFDEAYFLYFSKKTRKKQKKHYYTSQDLFFSKHVGAWHARLLRILRFFHTS